MSSQHKGIVTQIIGPVLDIRFAEGELPELRNAITIQLSMGSRSSPPRLLSTSAIMWCAASP